MSKCKTIHKPWGKEEWLELNDKYCYKRIYVNAGTKTSFQYHEKKLETNYLIEGKAELWLENDEGIIEKTIIAPGYFFTVYPPRKHRVIAITDIIMQEVSTPEVDDVIRINDEFNRGNGKILEEHMKPALCILAAGLGTRLENLSEHINKGLLPLDNRAIISHMIDKAREEYEIVIALGYKGNMIKEYCEAAHPERNFIFVEVDKYHGPGTGPSYSINKCREYLQRPFIWAAVDTIITDKLPAIDTNWLGVYPTGIPELYATIDALGDKVINLKNKDKKGYNNAFIGLAGVYDYKTFWEELDVSSGEIVSAYYNSNKYSNIKAKNIFEKSIQYCIPKVNGEFLYKVGDTYVKLSPDENFIQDRIRRAKNLNGLVPPVTYKGKNLYSYKWVDGKTLYNLNKIDIFKEFLSFAKEKLWKVENINKHVFNETCKSFYYDKTKSRLKAFLSKREDSFRGGHTVNGLDTEPIDTLLSNFPWNKIYDGIPTKMFHGDFHFDHVVYGADKNFYLLDWRQDFAGTDTGDVYYDLSKMYGGILMCYELMKKNENFSCSMEQSVVTYTYKSVPELDKFKPIYEKWIIDNGYDLDKVKLITSLIYLNMAPLHEKEFGDMLFFRSKKLLQEISDKRL